MAGLTLYYIPGISREDTPVFSNRTKQLLYFESKTKLSITDGFYPPHYRDKIDLELELVTHPPGTAPSYEIRWNYISILFNDKMYFYFVDKIEYVNEEIVSFYISMDTIQTYMFDINWIESHITRKSIVRWIYDNDLDNWLINRDYLRENFSGGKFILKEKKYYYCNNDFSEYTGDDKITGYIICKTPGGGDAIYESFTSSIYNPGLFSRSYSSAKYTFFPEILGTLDQFMIWDNDTTNAKSSADNINKFVHAHPDTVFAYYLPFDVTSFELFVDTNYNFSLSTTAAWYSNDNGGMKINDGEGLTSHVLNDFVQFEFEHPGDTAKPFSHKYIPALLDESYYQICWGEVSAKSKMALHALTLPSVTLSYLGDIFTGKRAYFITPTKALVESESNPPSIYRSVIDTYNTLVIANDLITVDVESDAFKQYYTYNKASSVINSLTAVAALAALFI